MALEVISKCLDFSLEEHEPTTVCVLTLPEALATTFYQLATALQGVAVRYDSGMGYTFLHNGRESLLP